MIKRNGKNPIISVEQLQQPGATSCVLTCVAMVTGVPIETYIARFGEGPQSSEVEISALIESGIFPMAIPHGGPHPFPLAGVYLVSVPSLNLFGQLHRVVVEASRQTYLVYDPNAGRKSVQAYPKTGGIMAGEMPCVDVTYLCPSTLLQMQGPSRDGVMKNSKPVVLFTSPDWDDLLKQFEVFGIEGHEMRCQKHDGVWHGQIYEVKS